MHRCLRFRRIQNVYQIKYVHINYTNTYLFVNRIDGVMVSVLTSSVEDRGFEPRSGQTKDCKIGICCFSAKQGGLRRKSKDWLALNQNNVSEWGDMSTRGLKQSGPHHHFIET